MFARDKYTVFDRKVRKYRKGVHSEFFSIFFLDYIYILKDLKFVYKWLIYLSLVSLIAKRNSEMDTGVTAFKSTGLLSRFNYFFLIGGGWFLLGSMVLLSIWVSRSLFTLNLILLLQPFMHKVPRVTHVNLYE